MKLTNIDRTTYNHTRVGEWLDCRFESDEEEEFLIELKKEEGEIAEGFVARCAQIAEDNGFEGFEFIDIVDAELAEMMGLDTY
jgi:hypothetical protein